MAYEVDIAAIVGQVGQWPPGAQAAFREAVAVLELVPRDGRSMKRSNPGGAFRFLTLSTLDGSSFVSYVIVEHDQRVSLVDVVWT